MIPGMLTAAGIGLSIVSSTIAATQGAKQGQTGLASGLVNTSRQAGGGIGLAVLITLATQHTSHLIGTGQQVPEALTEGFRLAYLIGAGLTGDGRRSSPSGWCAVRRRSPARCCGGWPSRSPSRWRSAPSSRSTTRSAGPAARRSARTRHAGPTCSPPRRGCTRRSCASTGRPPSTSSPPATSSPPTSTTSTIPPLVGQSGPLILDSHLQPVWFRPVPINEVAGNLSLQR